MVRTVCQARGMTLSVDDYLSLIATAADGRLPVGSVVVCTVTGNGLKDPDTAMGFMTDPVVLPVAAEAVTDALGLTG